jgi:hypothetical protein
MAEQEKGYSVNTFEDIEAIKREKNGWGFTRDDLERYNVHMVTDVRFTWDESTPPELRKAFAEGSCVLHYIAEKQIMGQLEYSGLKPTSTRDLLYGDEESGKTVLLRDTGWRPNDK